MQLPVAIRGGAHNGAGFAGVDDGLVIDLSTMRGVRVDPKGRTARVGAGCTTGEVDHATHAFGQAVPFGIISTTGVAGLTLSGGHGYLSRQYGLACDNLIEADVVLADGSFVTASESENSDLLWALRGGGGNFGVVTSFLFRTHPAKTLYGGPIIFDLADAAAVMRWYREFQRTRAGAVLQSSSACRPCRPADPFPREHWNKRCASCSSPTTARHGRGRGRRRPRRPPEAAHRLGGADRLSGAAEHVRRAESAGDAMVLERRFRRHRCPTPPSTPIIAHAAEAPSTFSLDAPLPDRRRGASEGQAATRPGAPATRPGRWSSPASTRTRPKRQS